MPRSLADGHIKIAVLTEEPAIPSAPTAAELNAGIGGALGAACNILLSDWTFGPADSETIAERAVCEDSTVEAFGASNYVAGFTVFRYFDPATGLVDDTEDALFTAVKAKGSRLWVYERETGQEWDEPWTAADELFFGAELITDLPQKPGESGGYIKRRIPAKVQKGYPNAVVGPVVP